LVVLGIVLDGEDRPIASFLMPGNTADVTTLVLVVTRLEERFGLRKACVVADRGMISAATIAALEAPAASTTSWAIERVRQQFVEQGLEAALLPKPAKQIYARKLDVGQEAHLIALACSAPPEGKGRWTLRLLAEQMVELQHVDALSHEAVRQALPPARCAL
jgi:hypothetical protein